VNELVAQDGVVMLTGSYFSNIAVSDYARERKVMYLAGKPSTDAILVEGQCLYVPTEAIELYAGGDAGGAGGQAAGQALGDDRAQL
jgi:hypothetical protein